MAIRFASPLGPPIRRWMRRAFPHQPGGIDYDQPPGDPGLFEPGGVTWRVHADFPGMLSGGLCALMLQTLHPAALADSLFTSPLVYRGAPCSAGLGQVRLAGVQHCLEAAKGASV